MGKQVYIEGEALYLRPTYLDKGENLPDGSDIKEKIMKTEGIYSTKIILPFDNRDDAEDYLKEKGIPTEGMFGQLLKKEVDTDGNKIITYKVTRGHIEPKFIDEETGEPMVMGPPYVVDNSEPPQKWNPEILIGNGSKIRIKIDIWSGTKVTKLRWEAVQVVDLVPYESPSDGGF